MDDMDPVAALHSLGGVARTAQLHRRGVRDGDIARAWSDCRIDRVRKGVWAVDRRTRVAVAAAHGGMVGCVSALRERGVWILHDGGELHVHVGAKGRVHPHEGCNCVDHHTIGPTAFGIMPIADALTQSLACLTPEAFFAAFESAWNLGVLGPADRARVRELVPTATRALLWHARSDAESGLESLVRLRLLLLGIETRSQVHLPGIGRVDLMVGNLIIELDGRLNHDGSAARHRDLQRDAAATSLGYRVLRFDYAMVIHNWPRVCAAILAALA